MKFRVNEGQKIPFFDGKVRGFHEAGVELEGPAWWAKEFEGRMTPIDDKGNTVDPKSVADAAPELASATKAHEKAGLLRELAAANPALADILLPEATALEAAAEEEVAAAQKERRAQVKEVSAGTAAPVGATVIDDGKKSGSKK